MYREVPTSKCAFHLVLTIEIDPERSGKALARIIGDHITTPIA
jgi:hypothetical protein